MCPPRQMSQHQLFQEVYEAVIKLPNEDEVIFRLWCFSLAMIMLVSPLPFFKGDIVKAPRCFLFHPTVKQVHHYSGRQKDHTFISRAETCVHNLPAGRQASHPDHFRLQSRRRKRRHASVPVPGNAPCKFKNPISFLYKCQFHLQWVGSGFVCTFVLSSKNYFEVESVEDQKLTFST